MSTEITPEDHPIGVTAHAGKGVGVVNFQITLNRYPYVGKDDGVSLDGNGEGHVRSAWSDITRDDIVIMYHLIGKYLDETKPETR